MNRSSRLYIKGGGMILDLAGFAASIYMRGIKNITHIPTTLLAMVDGTVGGKTAINYKGVKNLIGSIITSPIDILIYVPYLYTLPRRELLNGMA
jgi:3-dehydroquinate synthase